MLAKSTGKSQRAEEQLEKSCDDSPVPVSAPGEGGTLLTERGVAGLWITGFICPHNSPSSPFPLDVSDSLGFFSEGVFGREDVEGSPYSSPCLGSKHYRSEQLQLQSSFTSVCNSSVRFYSGCNSPKLQPGGTSTGQIPPVTSGTHSGAGSWCFPCVPHTPSKGS